ncbi:LysR family transcriptional regulator [Streptomyces sp. ATE26]|uniref:LysR family transcriptional regulator n=1 Tax=Streptomyces sp. ATE26 TaxID=2954237 RepID=UPI0024822AA6|nr:LysR family transcriptional regulator [Streptomyces sp. ATE26]MDI1457885.1 LysR family transcriptional regulator [Streptomyces sp. ATE26]
MDLSLLRTFLAAYRSGSLTAAARQLGLSQPTVTAQVRALEEQLGLQLFRRLPRGIAPTSVADELAAETAPHVDALNAIAERGLSRHAPFSRPLHLGGPAELTGTRVLPALAPLIEDGLRLRITLGLPEELLAGLSQGRFDLVISTVRPRGRNIAAVPLTDEEFVLVAAPSWAERIDVARLAREGAPRLRGVPLISYAEDMPLIRRYWRTVFTAHPAGSPAVVVPDLRAVLTAAVAGAGVTVLPTYLCAAELASGHLVKLLNVEVPPLNTLFVAVRPGTEENPGVGTVRTRLLMQARLW